MSLFLGLKARMNPSLVCLVVISDGDILTKFGGIERVSAAEIKTKKLMFKNTCLGKMSSSLLQSDVWSDAVWGAIETANISAFVASRSIRIRMIDNLFVVEVICLQYVVILN